MLKITPPTMVCSGKENSVLELSALARISGAPIVLNRSSGFSMNTHCLQYSTALIEIEVMTGCWGWGGVSQSCPSLGNTSSSPAIQHQTLPKELLDLCTEIAADNLCFKPLLMLLRQILPHQTKYLHFHPNESNY